MKKGFTLVELIVSFVLITVVSISLFKTVLSVQQKQSQNIAINRFKAFQLLLNNEIESDFLKETIESVDECGTNCYDIRLKGKGAKRLSIDKIDNVITYGSLREKLPDNYKLIDDITVTKYESTTEGINSYIFLNIPIKSSLEPSLDSLKYMYTYDSTKEDIGGDAEESTSGFTTDDLGTALLLKMYPVGSIYTSTSNTNPGTLFGGVWVAYGSGRILVGVDNNDSDFNAAAKTGGEKTHTLTVSEIPSHSHTGIHWNTPTGKEWSDVNTSSSKDGYGRTVVAAKIKTISWVTGNAGGGSSHNNLQPYVTVYRFRRTN